MNSDIERYFMLNPETKSHHTISRGLYKHFPNTCNTYDFLEQYIYYVDPHDKGLENTSYGLPTEIRIVPSSKGLIVVLYFDQGEESHIVFNAQIGSKRGAWQNLSWEPSFHLNWNEKRIDEAINNFLWVAECEEAEQVLPIRNYIE